MIRIDTSDKHFMLPLCKEVRQLEVDYCHQQNIPSYQLMQRAGNAIWALMEKRFAKAEDILIITGPGNNAGDGFELAWIAAKAGKKVRLKYLYKNKKNNEYVHAVEGDAAIALKQLQQASIVIEPFDEADLKKADLIIDTLLGTGIKAPAREEFIKAINAINNSGIEVLAVDVPSGLDADKGSEIGCAIRATATLSFIGIKPGLVTSQGKECCGELYFDDLGVSSADLKMARHDQLTSLEFEAKLCSKQLLTRAPNSHKGSHGRTLIIGGNLGMGGAAMLAADAACRAGSGAVMMITRPEHVAANLARRPEIMVIGTDSGVDAETAILALKAIESATAIVVGPGLGDDVWAGFWLRKALTARVPTVVDADGIRLSKKLRLSLQGTIITPHPGEAASLLGKEFSTASAIQQNRFKAATQLQQQTKSTVILKGAGSIIAISAGENTTINKVCRYGNPGMASAGMGDLLAGVIGALLAQGFDNNTAAILGTLIHSRSADKAAAKKPIGMLASDCMKFIRLIRNQLVDFK